MLTIRSGVEAELEQVLALWREAEAVPGATDSEAALVRLLETGPDSLLVAEVEGELVGTLIVAWDGWRGNLYRLAVARSHRRPGIARTLLVEGERRLRKKGAVRISALAIAESEAPGCGRRWGTARTPASGASSRTSSVCPMQRSAIAALAVVLAAGCGGSQPREDTEPSLGLQSEGATTTTTKEAAPADTAPTRAAAPRPAIRQHRIPFDERRKEETEAYAERHYGTPTSTLDPKLIVEHVSVTPSAQAVYDTFASDRPDVELHELPNVCSHFVIDRDGTIYQLVSLELICRHTVGLNDHAIGIEHVGATDAEVLGNSAQMDSSLRLTRWLRCRYGISMNNVIGHNESLSSPYHHERVASLRNQTHDDWTNAEMDVYRTKLRKLRC